MSNPVAFNINGYVRVKLTDHGRAVNKAGWDALFADAPVKREHTPAKEDAEGWSKWQLWTLMRRFGDHMGNGTDLCFETDIQIELPDPES